MENENLKEQLVSIQEVGKRQPDPAPAAGVAQSGLYMEKMRALARLTPASVSGRDGGSGGNLVDGRGDNPSGGNGAGGAPARRST